MSKQLNPANTICVFKHNGHEVGRIPATSKNLTSYTNLLAQSYKELTVERIEDSDAAMIGRMLAR